MRATITMNKYDTFSLSLDVSVVAGYILVPSHYNISTSFGVIFSPCPPLSISFYHFKHLAPNGGKPLCKKKWSQPQLSQAKNVALFCFMDMLYFFLNFVRTADLLLCFVSFPHFFQHAKIYCCCW